MSLFDSRTFDAKTMCHGDGMFTNNTNKKQISVETTPIPTTAPLLWIYTLGITRLSNLSAPVHL
jgi:hypothetical protein